ncbi:hypothetical protein PZA11_007559 [Diplocarpon coronariae]|uniref:Methyltransferase type 11 domain-containing protein n=1 Tax=Diplocarpon coronariae TaxID=2795749 RepID=A0A218YY83_9HELO|nr:hypothetical protein B2J93_5394 [Marssonina coronariae]
MATFAKSSFNALTYATFRPTYPPQILARILAYHSPSPRNLAVDLGCGHGLISRSLGAYFTRVLGTDPSLSMIEQARSTTPAGEYGNVELRQARAEELRFLREGQVDVVVAGQAAHWFDYSKTWPELARVVRRGGTLAFWGYKDNIFVDYPAATKVLNEYCYGAEKMGPYWEQPGRNILRSLYRDIVPPGSEWENVQRLEYEPSLEGRGKEQGKGVLLMGNRLRLGEVEGYVRTFSAFVNWKAEFEERSREEGGEGDVVDRMFDEMREVEGEWKKTGEAWRNLEVENEWGSVLLLARRR